MTFHNSSYGPLLYEFFSRYERFKRHRYLSHVPRVFSCIRCLVGTKSIFDDTTFLMIADNSFSDSFVLNFLEKVESLVVLSMSGVQYMLLEMSQLVLYFE